MKKGIQGPDRKGFCRQCEKFGFDSKWYVPAIRRQRVGSDVGVCS